MIDYIINFLAIFLVLYVGWLILIVYRFDTIRKKLSSMKDHEILKYIKDYYELPDNDFYCYNKCVANACEEYDFEKCKTQCEICKKEMQKPIQQ